MKTTDLETRIAKAARATARLARKLRRTDPAAAERLVQQAAEEVERWRAAGR